MEAALPVPIPPLHAMPHFLGGLIYGMTAENHLQEIEACYTGAEMMYPEI